MGQITVQSNDFDVNELYQTLSQSSKTGAVAMFVGLVRDFTETLNPSAKDTLNEQETFFELEHYPRMTEHNLEQIVKDANQRWDLHDVIVVHRVGKLFINDQIVFVGVSASHRTEALQACEFIMDYLKSKAAFWKKESHLGHSEWVSAQDSDETKRLLWENNENTEKTTVQGKQR